MSDLSGFGRDDGIRCYKCGGATFLTYDQGYGLRSYDCEDEKCGEISTVQFEWDEPDDEEEFFDEPYPDESMEAIEDDPECE